ncbi:MULTISPECIES: chaplin [Streptomyces]|uniref:chaplin n=1 Tax=Streptomyces TaxID=1883 RepID=UPI000CD4A600|nr:MULTISPECIES: chaplin [Streptomyces]
MKNLKKAVTVTMMAGGILAAGVGGAAAQGGAGAEGVAANSPGVLSGNLVQVPVHVPINACGNTVNVVGLLNPTFGNTCINDSSTHYHKKW